MKPVSVDLAPCGSAAPLGAAGWLRLAAAPTFAVMALLTAVCDPMAGMICQAGHGFALGGMAPMYLLMSLFHLPAWLCRLPNRRSPR